MRKEERALRLTGVFYRLLFRKMFQSIASSMPSFDDSASTVSAESFSPNSFAAAARSPRKEIREEGLFERFVQALHDSRRLQAARTFRQYRHLIDGGWHRFAARPDVGGHGIGGCGHVAR